MLTSAASTGATGTLTGTLNSAPLTDFTLEFFSNSARDPSGYGQGESFVGTITVTTDASGNATFTFPFSMSPGAGYVGPYFTATATDPNGNTSEFSADIALSPAEVAPVVTGIDPTSGPTAGGTTVLVTGSGFTGTTAVSFGTTPASKFSVLSGSQISAVSPVHAIGTVDVTVTNAAGTSPTVPADQFTYVAMPSTPTVTGISPTSGSTAGGTLVTITGTNLLSVIAVYFGNTPAASFTMTSPTSMTAVAPASAAGTVDVTVTTASGVSSSSSADRYTFYAPPVVTGIGPNTGPVTGGTSVAISGSGFTGATSVSFGTAAATYVVNSDTQITATAPVWPLGGVVDIKVATAHATSGTSSADQFTYYGSTVSGLSPTSGPTAGGTSVVITGAHEDLATGVFFGPKPASSFTINSATQITATSPSGTVGTVDVTVKDGTYSSPISSADQYSYTLGGGALPLVSLAASTPLAPLDTGTAPTTAAAPLAVSPSAAPAATSLSTQQAAPPDLVLATGVSSAALTASPSTAGSAPVAGAPAQPAPVQPGSAVAGTPVQAQTASASALVPAAVTGTREQAIDAIFSDPSQLAVDPLAWLG